MIMLFLVLSNVLLLTVLYLTALRAPHLKKQKQKQTNKQTNKKNALLQKWT